MPCVVNRFYKVPHIHAHVYVCVRVRECKFVRPCICVPEAEQCSSLEWPTAVRIVLVRTHSTSQKKKMITFSEKRLVDSLVDVLFYRGKCANSNDVAKVKCVQFLLFSLAFFALKKEWPKKTGTKFRFRTNLLFGLTLTTHLFVHTLCSISRVISTLLCDKPVCTEHWLSESLEDSYTAAIFDSI